jgi:hypothetical protein
MAAGSTYTPIATQTLGSGQTSVTFSSIPATYTDLVVISNMAFTTSSLDFRLQVGTGSIDTGSNYSSTHLIGTGTAASSDRNNATTYIAGYRAVGGGTNLQTAIHNIQNYANTTTKKAILYRVNDSSAEILAGVALWNIATAIDTIKLAPTGTFASGSTFTLYGITAA